ncbi:MAG: DNA polymerase III subunit alpha [Coriobacteriia bacterium]
MDALAVTDHGAMYGAVEFYRAAKAADIKPIIGAEVYFTTGSRKERSGKPEHHHLLLLAKDNEGYRNLMRIVSRAFLEGFYYRPQVDEELLREHSQGLIATSACMSGIVSKCIERGDEDGARAWAQKYAQIFGDGDFYLEIQDQGIRTPEGVTQADLCEGIAALADELGLPIVGTNDIHYVNEGDHYAQDILLCVGTGSTLEDKDRMRFNSDQFYMKDPGAMERIFSRFPEAVTNTLEIAGKCNVEVEFDKFVLPHFEVPEGHDQDSYLERKCREGLVRRYGEPVPQEALDRLEYELGVIREKRFAAYFLVVEDFVSWAKQHGIGVGPGRGSAAGSIISYALGITNLDPLEYGLLFERFLNPERTEMPDIDIDFDDERRSEVIEYVRNKYGEDRVAQIITFSTMKARMAIRDAGRVLGYPYNVPDRIAKQVPEMLTLTDEEEREGVTPLEKALRENPELREEYAAGGDTKRIIDAARMIEGVVRGDGVHAAGVVICRDPLTEHTPVKRTKGEDGDVVTQYPGELIASLGLLKMDFLGLRTLTVIADAIEQIERNHGVKIDVDEIPLDDEKTWNLLREADTTGVFQVESAGMRRLLRDLAPERLGDLVALVALFRPGPLQSGMADDFVARKHGRAPVTYYDERLKHILEETYGTMVYQEQVMLISMEMAGFTAARADALRKAMGKKKRAIIDRMREEFVEGAVARGYDRELAEQVYTDIEKFAEYAFNKSHSAAYGLIAYQTAYLKAHYPLEYMAAVLSSYMGNTDRLVKYLAECARAGIEVLPPDVNESRRKFAVAGGKIRFGLLGIRGVGDAAVDAIVKERETGGPYTSLPDFCSRVDMRTVNKRTLEALIKAGAFDSTGYTRKHLMAMLETCVAAAAARQRDREANQSSLFDLEEAGEAGLVEHVEPPNGDEWPKRVKLGFEKEALGIFVSDHPLRDVADRVREASTFSLGDREEFRDGMRGYFAGLVSNVEKTVTRTGKMMMRFVLEDLEGSIRAIMFPKVYERWGSLVTEDAVVRVRGRLDTDDQGGATLIVDEVGELDSTPAGDRDAERSGEARREAPDGPARADERAGPGRLDIAVDDRLISNGGTARLKEILSAHRGPDTVYLQLSSGRTLRLPDDLAVDATSASLADALDAWLGEGWRPPSEAAS